MTDIVERLRKPTSFLTIEEGTRMHREAADEIERLNKEGGELAAIIRQQGFENERLRMALQRIADDGKNCNDYCRKQAARALKDTKP